MATIYPSIETIKLLRQKPTDGEKHLLEFLDKTLDDTYEVFFQPFLNGDRPDIIIMRKGSGVYIIEVKDWDLSLYKSENRGSWKVVTKQGEWQEIKSPISQVFSYKENLYNLHIEGLLEKRIKNPKFLSIVNCGVYFHKETTDSCKSFILEEYQNNDEDEKKKNEKYIKFLSHFDFLGYDSLNPEDFTKIMRKNWMNMHSYIFDSDLYDSFKRHLQPPIHELEQGIQIIYSSEQKRVIESKENSWQKIKGVAGSGKTLCLAKRAVNAYIRHNNNVLILTFNISLRNYIHDKINEVRENFEWSNFHIVHYHEFIKSQVNNYNLKITGLDAWDNPNLFEDVKDSIYKYDTIIIDEIQDYTETWINLILKYFLKDNGEYVVFGDEKQNIYHRAYDKVERKPTTKIQGQWNLLKRSYRVSNNIARLAVAFQQNFFTSKYELDNIDLQQTSIDEKSELFYFFLDTFNCKKIIELYKSIASDLNVHDNDICFQASHVDLLRELDHFIRTTSTQKTNTMFETQEIYEKFKNDYGDTETFKDKIEHVRKNKKFNFWDNRGLLKMSTIHSFKGWEIDTLFLFILEDNEDNISDFTTDELIYTAITRCKSNLIVININNEKYHSFFKAKIGESTLSNQKFHPLF